MEVIHKDIFSNSYNCQVQPWRKNWISNNIVILSSSIKLDLLCSTHATRLVCHYYKDER